MALFKYKAITQNGIQKEGSIDATNMELAIAAIQRRGLTLVDIQPADKKDLLHMELKIFERVKMKEIVVLSRQISTLFEAQISAVNAFKLLASEADNPVLQRHLVQIADDIQAGGTIAEALSKHPKLFSKFYIAMVRSGEESGRLDEVFLFLADYLDQTYAVTSKAKNALIYPAFIVFTFISVMVLMLTTVIPKLADVLVESGQEIPIYTAAIINLSNFLVDYFWFIGIVLVLSVVGIIRYAKTPDGKEKIARARMAVPYLGTLYKFLYLSRVADSLSTTLRSGIRLVRGLEISSDVVGDPVFSNILKETAAEVQTGKSVSETLRKYPDQFPGIMIAMMKVGEESGDMSKMLDVMAKFYRREVTGAVDTLVSMIEPLMIVMLALGVGVLLMSVLVPIYNISGSV